MAYERETLPTGLYNPAMTDPGLFDLSGCAALVFGAAGGLGSASALALAEHGADLALADLDLGGLEPVRREAEALGRRAVALQADVTRSAEVDAAVERTVAELGRLDVLVYSVGINVRRPSVEQTDDDWARILQVNLTGAFYACRAAGRAMLAAGQGGKMVVITSISSVLGHPGLAPYAASKGGLRQMIKVLAREWAPHGIAVNGVAPTYVETGLTRAYLAQPGMRERIAGGIPMGRLAEPRDVVGTVVYLASPASDFVTGQNILVAGGRELD